MRWGVHRLVGFVAALLVVVARVLRGGSALAASSIPLGDYSGANNPSGVRRRFRVHHRHQHAVWRPTS